MRFTRVLVQERRFGAPAAKDTARDHTMPCCVGYGDDGQLLLCTQDAAATAASAHTNSTVRWEAWESLAPESLQAVGGTEQLQGFAALKPEDQHKVAAALGGSAPAPPAEQAVHMPVAEPSTTAAAAAAIPEQHLSAVLLPHLPLLDSLSQDPRSICSLMCADKELLALLKCTCEGRMPLSFRARDSAHELQLAQWLSGRYSCGSTLLAGYVELQLLRQVKYGDDSWGPRGDEEGGASDNVAQQIEQLREVDYAQEARSERQGLEEVDAAMASGLLLQQLQAATQVTRLALTRDCYEAFAACSSAMQALAGLTNLCSISISSWDFSVCPAPLFKALQAVSCLTSLTVSRVTGTSKLRYLPASLRSLDLGVCSPGLCLTRLVRLTALRTDKLFSLESGDLLPASLQQLDIGEVNSVQRLVGMTALLNLSAYASHVPQLRLQRVAKCLTQLTRVQLCYQSGANEAAAAWPLLPLHHLELQEFDALTSTTLQHTALQQIRCLTQLTYLHIQRLDTVEADTWEIANVLQHLTELRGLRLWAGGPWPQRRSQQQEVQQNAAPAAAAWLHIADAMRIGPAASVEYARCVGYARFRQRMRQQAEEHQQQRLQDEAAAADVAEDAGLAATAAAVAGDDRSGKAGLTGAIAALPHLTHLSLSLQGLGSPAAAELGAATGLTSLKLRACGIDSAVLAGLVCDLKGLRSLFVEYNREVDDAVVPVLLQALTGLTELDVRYTGISSTAGELLQAVTRLQQLQL